MLESARSPMVMCNCITLLHQQGSDICRYEKPLKAKTQIMLEELLKGKTRYQIASYLNSTKSTIDDALTRVRNYMGESSSLTCARLALRWGWIQQ